jgi:hypothetical protein
LILYHDLVEESRSMKTISLIVTWQHEIILSLWIMRMWCESRKANKYFARHYYILSIFCYIYLYKGNIKGHAINWGGSLTLNWTHKKKMYCSSAINFDYASVIIFFTSTCIWFERKVIWFFTLLALQIWGHFQSHVYLN